MNRRQSHYELLGVQPDATRQEIRAAFLALAHRLHPDLNSGCRETDEAFKQLRIAYETLSNPSSRRDYDSKRNAFVKKPRVNADFVVPNPTVQTNWLNDPFKRRERILFGLGFVVMVAVLVIGMVVQDYRTAYFSQLRLEAAARKIERRTEERANSNREEIEQPPLASSPAHRPNRVKPNTMVTSSTSKGIPTPKKQRALSFDDLMIDVSSANAGLASVGLSQDLESQVEPAVLSPAIDDLVAPNPDLSFAFDDVLGAGTSTALPIPSSQDVLMPKDPLFNMQPAHWESGSAEPAGGTLSSFPPDTLSETQSSSYTPAPRQSFLPPSDLSLSYDPQSDADFSRLAIPLPHASRNSISNPVRSTPFSPDTSYDFGYGRRNVRKSLQSPRGLRANGMSNPLGSQRLQPNSFSFPQSRSGRSSFSPAPISAGLPTEYQH